MRKLREKNRINFLFSEVVSPFTFSFIGVKGLIQSPLFLENFISSDYDTLAVQRESESGIERYATTTCRISSVLSIPIISKVQSGFFCSLNGPWSGHPAMTWAAYDDTSVQSQPLLTEDHAMRAAAGDPGWGSKEAVPMTALPGPVVIDCQAPGRCAE